jgi:protocatechuate 3,4-dioxygenase beta subunit
MSTKVHHITIVFLFLLLSAGLYAAEIQGIVSDQQGQAIPEVQVSACSFTTQGDSISYHTTTAADGSYKLENLLPGTYKLICTHPLYFPYRSEPFTLNDAVSLLMNVMLTARENNCTNSVSGHVYSAPPLLPAFIPLAGANVFLTSNNSTFPTYYTKSNDDGLYEFKNILPGIYYLSAEAFGHTPQYNIDTIQVTDGADIAGVDIYLVPVDPSERVRLSGHVWSAENDDPAQYVPQPVYPAYITLTPSIYYMQNQDSSGFIVPRPEPPSITVINNPDGSYDIPNIPKGFYNVSCSARGFKTEYIRNLDLSTGDVTQDFYLTPITIPPRGRITGKVHFDGSNLPVVHAYISFYPVDRNGPAIVPADSNFSPDCPQFRGVFTNEQGEYHAYLPQGKYYVSCEYNYLWDRAKYFYQEFYDDAHSLADATPVAVLPEQTTNDINFGIPSALPVPAVTVTGRVTDDQNNPLAKALVRVQQIYLPIMAINSCDCGTHIGYTDEDGYYTIRFKLEQVQSFLSLGPFPLNSFIVSAEKPGYRIEFYKEKPEPFLADVLFAFGDTVFTNIDFTLEPFVGSNSISGIITTENGQPLVNAFVIGARITSGEIAFTFTDSLGRYTLNNLQEDYYYLLFAAQGYIPEFYDNAYIWEDAKPVLAKGQITGIDASLTAMYRNSSVGILSGVIKNENDQSLQGVLVLIKNKDGEVLNYGISDEHGTYQIQGVPDGSQQICVSKVNYASSTTWIDFNFNESSLLLMNFTLSGEPVQVPKDNKPQTMVPTQIELLANYPNPFNPATHIRFGLPTAQQVKLVIYDILGREVVQLIDADMSAGMHDVLWDGTDHTGRPAASGIYFYALQGDGFRLVKKMILNR